LAADGCGYRGRMLVFWFDHPLIEAWLERQLAASPTTTSSDDAGGGSVGAASTCSIGATSTHSGAP